MTTQIESIIDINALTEDEAFHLFSKMSSKFGWAGTIFTRDDVEGMLEQYDLIHDGETINKFTDEQWTDFTNNKDWYRYVPEWLHEEGWEIVNNVLDDWLRERNLLV